MKPNTHKNCGGKLVKMSALVYKCNRCNKRKQVYKKNKKYGFYKK